MFRVRTQTVGTAVLCGKRRLLLADEVGLNGEPVTVVMPICFVALRRKKRRSKAVSKESKNAATHHGSKLAAALSMRNRRLKWKLLRSVTRSLLKSRRQPTYTETSDEG